MPLVLVTGGTGYVGSSIIRRLWCDGNENVIACVRDQKKAAEFVPEGVPVRVADYDDLSGLTDAFKGIQQLFVVPSDGFGSTMLRHIRNVFDAAKASSVDHIVFLSIVDVAGDSPFYYAPVYRDAEARLRATGITWTILRCGLYADFVRDSLLRGSLPSGELLLPAETSRVSLISRNDVATAAASVLQSLQQTDQCAGKVFSLTGSEALSFDDIAKQASEVYETALVYKPVEPADYLLRLWDMPDPWPHAFSTLFLSIVEGRFALVSEGFEMLTGRPAETFAQFLSRGKSPT